MAGLWHDEFRMNSIYWQWVCDATSHVVSHEDVWGMSPKKAREELSLKINKSDVPESGAGGSVMF